MGYILSVAIGIVIIFLICLSRHPKYLRYIERKRKMRREERDRNTMRETIVDYIVHTPIVLLHDELQQKLGMLGKVKDDDLAVRKVKKTVGHVWVAINYGKAVAWYRKMTKDKEVSIRSVAA